MRPGQDLDPYETIRTAPSEPTRLSEQMPGARQLEPKVIIFVDPDSLARPQIRSRSPFDGELVGRPSSHGAWQNAALDSIIPDIKYFRR